ncbi:hypothetical protein MNBD_ALPHA04-760 [hydrothermal vent metagenome]|uniref:Lipoprotein n=1 Tax=hydrothermal vent metagenome TaxID=652676 RepID=A0A3B0SF29_9ZZZZ
MMKLAITLAALAVCACAPTNGNERSGGVNEPLKSAKDEVKILSVPTVMPAEPNGDIGDGVLRPMLQPMGYKEFSRAVEDGVGCSFIATGNHDPIFVATAPDSATVHGKATIKMDGRLHILEHKGVGISQIEEGSLFTADNIELRIKHPNVEPTTSSKETYFWSAKLSITKYNGGTNEYEGRYECGA